MTDHLAEVRDAWDRRAPVYDEERMLAVAGAKADRATPRPRGVAEDDTFGAPGSTA